MTDPVTSYAKAVLRKRKPIVAGPHVRNACRRHLRDLKEQKERGLYFDIQECNKAISFFSDVLFLSGGEHEGAPFVLVPWQEFVVGSIFGWRTATYAGGKIDEIGYRRFSKAFIETAKGSGKSPLAAGVGLKMMCADREPKAEVYSVATKRDQAMIMFRDAISMYKQSPELYERLKSTGAAGREWNLYYLENGSFFRPIGSESQGKGHSGPRPHCNLFDEIHEHPNNAMIEFLSAGKKNRRQALDFMITNSGHDKTSVCYEYHEYGCKVADPDSGFEDDRFFSYICSLDEDEDPFTDEACWPKVNPSLPSIPGYDYLRTQVTEARGLPSKESIVRRLNFCEWVDAADPWISRDLWNNVIENISWPEDELPCVAAIDLGAKFDLTAMTVMFEDPSGFKQAITEFWTPKDTIPDRVRKDRAPYDVWAKDGFLNAVPGKSIDYSFVAQEIKKIHEKYNLKIIAFDRWRIEDLIRELDDLGVDCYHAKIDIDDHGVLSIVPKDKYSSGIAMLDHGQGFRDMSPAIDDLEAAISNEEVLIQSNPVMNNCAANAVLEKDAAENRKFTKKKSTGRIDGMISLAMATRVISYIDCINDQTASRISVW